MVWSSLGIPFMRLTVIAAVWSLLACTVGAQEPFGPPPAPAAQPSASRGVYDPKQYMNSPATIVPAPAKPQAEGVNAPPASISLANATPLEGGEIVARIDGQIVLASDVTWQVNKIIEANRDRIPPDEIEKARALLL